MAAISKSEKKVPYPMALSAPKTLAALFFEEMAESTKQAAYINAAQPDRIPALTTPGTSLSLNSTLSSPSPMATETPPFLRGRGGEMLLFHIFLIIWYVFLIVC